MKAITTTLQTFLNSATQAAVADLLTITLANGTILYATNADKDITWAGNTYSSSAILFSRTKSSSATGGKVSNVTLTIYAASTMLLGGIPILQAIRAHAMDGAMVRIDSMFLTTAWVAVGIVNNFYGMSCGIECGRTSAKLTIKAPTHLFDQQMPRNLFQPGCMHTLFDSQCSLSRASYAVAGAVQAGSGNTIINCNTLAQASGYFTKGYLAFSSGQNSGLRYTVSSSSASVGVTLQRPLIYPVATGDTFNVYPGCDRTQTTCTNKFGNLVHFRAFPYVPVPESAF